MESFFKFRSTDCASSRLKICLRLHSLHFSTSTKSAGLRGSSRTISSRGKLRNSYVDLTPFTLRVAAQSQPSICEWAYTVTEFVIFTGEGQVIQIKRTLAFEAKMVAVKDEMMGMLKKLAVSFDGDLTSVER